MRRVLITSVVQARRIVRLRGTGPRATVDVACAHHPCSAGSPDPAVFGLWRSRTTEVGGIPHFGKLQGVRHANPELQRGPDACLRSGDLKLQRAPELQRWARCLNGVMKYPQLDWLTIRQTTWD